MHAYLGAAITVAVLPVYWLLRWRFFSLPLHIDTGFYVSNDTVYTHRWKFRNGWNARYAGCSKLLPEAVYSLLYLQHGPAGYKVRSRAHASLYNLFTAVAVGLLCAVSVEDSGHFWAYYAAGLIAFVAVSSQPQWGVYFENAELFELLPQVAGVVLMASGLDCGSHIMLAAGVALWWLESFFIKLSSAPAALVLTVWAVWAEPAAWLTILVAAVVAVLAYGAWLLWNGRSPWSMLVSFRRRQRQLDRIIGFDAYAQRLAEKSQLLAHVLVQAPAVLILLAIGIGTAELSPTRLGLLLAYAVGVGVCYGFQAGRIAYLTVPFQPLLAIAAGWGGVWLLHHGVVGASVLAALVGAWLAMFGWYLLGGRDRMARWVWRVHATDRPAERNAALDRLAPELAAIVRDRSLLVYGSANQAYVYVGRSYPIDFVSPAVWLDAMRPDWQQELHDRMRQVPPSFILDTNYCFDARAAATRLGLAFQLERLWPEGYRLFKFVDRVEAPVPVPACRTHRSLNRMDIRLQEAGYE
ncbi:MAG: hypothetical protein JXA69_09270, partial [Phycisphaerae bacterium]|nr:hypothetical protein [Phycisphaerae bacterium]